MPDDAPSSMLIHGPDACSTHAASTATSSLGDWRHEITVRQGRATRLFQRSFPHTFACQPTSQRNRPVERGLECYGREAFLRIAFSEKLCCISLASAAPRGSSSAHSTCFAACPNADSRNVLQYEAFEGGFGSCSGRFVPPSCTLMEPIALGCSSAIVWHL